MFNSHWNAKTIEPHPLRRNFDAISTLPNSLNQGHCKVQRSLSLGTRMFYHLHSIVTPCRKMKVFPTRVIIGQPYDFKLLIGGRERLEPSVSKNYKTVFKITQSAENSSIDVSVLYYTIIKIKLFSFEFCRPLSMYMLYKFYKEVFEWFSKQFSDNYCKRRDLIYICLR